MSNASINLIPVHVRVDVTNLSNEKYNLFAELAERISISLDTQIDARTIQKALIDRESLGTTGFENGLAIPHGQIPELSHASIFFFRLKQEVEWEALDGKKVDTIFVLLVPKEEKENTHLTLLSSLSYHLLDESYQWKLKTEKNPEIIHEIIKRMLTKEEMA